MSLKTRIFTCFTVILIIPMMIVYLLADSELKKMVFSENEGRMRLAMKMVENYLEGLSEKAVISARNSAEKLSWTAVNEETLEKVLRETDFSGMTLKTGDNFLQAGNQFCLSDEVCINIDSIISRNQWKSFYYLCGNNLLLIGISPVMNGADTGTLICYSEMKPDFLDPLFQIAKMHISLFNLSGAVISSTVFDRNSRRDLKQISGVFTELTADKMNLVKEKITGQEHLCGYRRMEFSEQSQLFLRVALPEIAVSTAGRILLKYLQLVTLAAIILAAGVSFILSQSIVSPLRSFSRAAQVVSEGNLNFHIGISRKDEIGDLVRAFNEMTVKLKVIYDELRRKLFELDTLFRVSQLVNFEDNSEELLRKILKETCDALESEKASVFLLNAQNDLLELRMVVGVADGDIRSSVFMKIGEGIAGKVLGDGEGLIVNDGENHPLFKPSEQKSNGHHIRNLMCVPLKIKDSSFGVLNVSNRKNGGEYTESDLNLFKAVAAQVAINIENAKLYELSVTDGLTHLFVHRFMQIRLEEEIIRARRYKRNLSLLMMDIDHFKQFNDTYGHQTGDLVLISTAASISQEIRQNVDIAARYGGEEFAVILPEQDLEGAVKIAQRIRQRIENSPLKTGRYGLLKVTVSIGVASYPENALAKSDLIALADEALYQAKHGGRNMVCASQQKSG